MMINPFRCTNKSNNPKGEIPLRQIKTIGEYQDRKRKCLLLHKPLHPRQEQHKTTKVVVPHDAKRVCFSKQVLCRSIKRHDQPYKIWFTRREMEIIHQSCWRTIESMIRRLQEISEEKQQNADNDVIHEEDKDDYDKDDYKYEEHDDDLGMMENLPPTGDEKLCTRGFEQKTPNGAKLRAQNISKSRKIVMNWQLEQSQSRCGGLDAESLAQLYHTATEASSRAARARGLNDEREAMAILGL